MDSTSTPESAFKNMKPVDTKVNPRPGRGRLAATRTYSDLLVSSSSSFAPGPEYRSDDRNPHHSRHSPMSMQREPTTLPSRLKPRPQSWQPPGYIPGPAPAKPMQVGVPMDPNCAICRAPASLRCDCENKALAIAVKQAESRMMTSIYGDIRSWVSARAQDYILEHFRHLTERRQVAHHEYLMIQRTRSQDNYYYLQDLAAAQADFKRGIDEDWQASVQRYPEVLEYFYSLVEVTIPGDDDPMVNNPPRGALTRSRSVRIQRRHKPSEIIRSSSSGARSTKSVASSRFSTTSTLYEVSPLAEEDEIPKIEIKLATPRPHAWPPSRTPSISSTRSGTPTRSDLATRTPSSDGAEEGETWGEFLTKKRLEELDNHREAQMAKDSSEDATDTEETYHSSSRSLREKRMENRYITLKEFLATRKPQRTPNNEFHKVHKRSESPAYIPETHPGGSCAAPGETMADSGLVVNAQAHAGFTDDSDAELSDSDFSWSSSLCESIREPDMNHPLWQLRREYLRVVMAACYQSQNGGGSTSVSGTAPASNSTPSIRRSNGIRNQSSSRKHGRSPDAGSDSGDKLDATSSSSNKRRAVARELCFACPFAKKDPIRHRDCYRYFLTRIRDVKQHLKRCHRMPIHCPRCAEIFTDEDDRDDHLRVADCTVSAVVKIEGISEKQQKQLSQRVSSRMSEEDQWFTVFDILFPGHPHPRSPYLDRELSEQMQIFRDFLLVQGRIILSDFLESRGTLIWNAPPDESNLEAFQARTLADGLQLIFDRFTASSSADGPPSSNDSTSPNTFQSNDSGIGMSSSRTTLTEIYTGQDSATESPNTVLGAPTTAVTSITTHNRLHDTNHESDEQTSENPFSYVQHGHEIANEGHMFGDNFIPTNLFDSLEFAPPTNPMEDTAISAQPEHRDTYDFDVNWERRNTGY
ncbi:hypothetical protein BX600DRAFT_555110 [Xylariales sp. PMI_506]|nr:hypothetical protein BX600DRAFT_555110 [Xylariales sp. PMI_506]